MWTCDGSDEKQNVYRKAGLCVVNVECTMFWLYQIVHVLLCSCCECMRFIHIYRYVVYPFSDTSLSVLDKSS